MRLVTMERVISGGRRAMSASSVARMRASEVAGHGCEAARAKAGTRTTGGTMLGPEPSPRRANVIPVAG